MWQVIITTTTHRTSYLISLPINATIRRIFQLNYSPSLVQLNLIYLSFPWTHTMNRRQISSLINHWILSPPTKFVHPIWRVLRKITLSRRPETQTGIDRIHFLLKALVTWASHSDSVAFCLCRRGANSLSLSLTFTLDYFDEKEENVLSLALFYLF